MSIKYLHYLYNYILVWIYDMWYVISNGTVHQAYVQINLSVRVYVKLIITVLQSQISGVYHF